MRLVHIPPVAELGRSRVIDLRKEKKAVNLSRAVVGPVKRDVPCRLAELVGSPQSHP